MSETDRCTVIVKNNGAPFSDERTAKTAIASKNLDPAECRIVPHINGKGEGFAIKIVDTEDSKVFEAVEPDEAFYDEDDDELPAHLREAPARAVASPTKSQSETTEKYWWVKWTAKSDDNDPDDVDLCVNGETLQCMRDVEACVPQRFLENADHTEVLRFKQIPGKDRKYLAPKKVYTYTKLREGTKAEFLKQRNEGTKKQKDLIEKYGIDGGEA